MEIMKYFVPPIVIPVLLVVGIVAYAVLKPPIIASHPPVSVANSNSIEPRLALSEGPTPRGETSLMFHLPPPWVFAAIGSLLTVGSAVVGGFIAWKLERKEKKLEGEQRSETTKFVQIREKFSEGIIFYNFAQLKLAMAQLVPQDTQKKTLSSTLSSSLCSNRRLPVGCKRLLLGMKQQGFY
jgi:hypothetical protein